MSLNKILSSTKYVTDNAKDVFIDYKKINTFCSAFKKEPIAPWTNLVPVDFSIFNEEEKVKFLLIQDALNFCFWGDPKWEYYYKNKTHSGSMAMVIALFVGVEKNKKLLDFKVLKELNLAGIKKIFPTDKNNQNIPLIEERLKNLNDIGLGLELINKKYNRSLLEITNKFKDEEELFKFISKYFKSYTKDKAIYNGKQIYFYKRIQLVISDINALLYFGNKFSLDKLTIFADYKIPQLMRELEFINYSKKLSEIVDNKKEIKKDSKQEIEIRASIVQVGNYMASKLRVGGIEVNDAYIDNYMFTYMKKNDDLVTKPHHRVRTNNY